MSFNKKAHEYLYDTIDQFTSIFNLYQQASPTVQEIVRSMSAIRSATDSDEDEKFMAINTIIEALFPQYCSKISKD